MGLNVIRRDSVKDRKKKTIEELQTENEKLWARLEALEGQADASANQVLAVLLGGGGLDG